MKVSYIEGLVVRCGPELYVDSREMTHKAVDRVITGQQLRSEITSSSVLTTVPAGKAISVTTLINESSPDQVNLMTGLYK